MSPLVEVGVAELVQMDLHLTIYDHMGRIIIPTQGRVYSNIFGLKLGIMKLDTLKLVCKKL